MLVIIRMFLMEEPYGGLSKNIKAQESMESKPNFNITIYIWYIIFFQIYIFELKTENRKLESTNNLAAIGFWMMSVPALNHKG